MMARVISMSNDEWQRISGFVREELMTFDVDNPKLRAAVLDS